MEINIDIDGYISEEEKKDIAKSIFKQYCLEKYQSDHERIFGNVAYKTVRELINKNIGEDIDKMIKEKTIEVINNLSCFTVFKDKDKWDGSPKTRGMIALEETFDTEEAQSALKNKIISLIDEVSTYTISDLISEKITESLGNIFSLRAGE